MCIYIYIYTNGPSADARGCRAGRPPADRTTPAKHTNSYVHITHIHIYICIYRERERSIEMYINLQ